jgi:hypothetical protein
LLKESGLASLAPAISPGKLAAPPQNGDTCVRFRRFSLANRFFCRSLRLAFGKRFVCHSRSGLERREFIRERSSTRRRRSDNHYPKAPASGRR